MARYFAGNSLAAFARSALNIVESTTSGWFDSAYVASSILLPTIGSYIETAHFSATGTVWIRWDMRWDNNTSGRPTVMLSNDTTDIIRLNDNQWQYWNGSAWTNTGSTFTVSTSLTTYALKVTLNSGFECYANGVLVASGSGWSGSPTSATYFRCYSTSNTGNYRYSQVMVADYDLRQSHYMSAAINGNGSYTDGTGDYTTVDETVLDDNDLSVLPAVSNKRSFTKAAITVPTGYQISALVVNARGRVGGGTVTDGKLGVKSGATYSASSGKSFAGGFEPRCHIVDNDPNTSALFSQTNFNNAEVAIEAA